MGKNRVRNPGLEIQQIVTNIQSGNPEKALKACRAILKAAPRNFDALQLGAIAATQLGQLETAVKHYKAAIRVKADYPDVYFNLGDALKELNRPEEAIANYRQTLKLRPGDVEIHNNIGNAQFDLEQYDAAIASYKIVLRALPGHAVAHNNLGNALRGTKQYDEAIGSYRRATEHKPDYARAHANLGNVLADVRQYETAVASYQRALSLDPEYASAHNNLGNTLCSLRQYQAAIFNYKRALHLKPNYADAHAGLGNALSNLSLYKEAVASYRQAIEFDAHFADAHNNLGNALDIIGDHKNAFASYGRALAIEPDDGIFLLACATASRKLCDWHDYTKYGIGLRDKLESSTTPLHPFGFLAFSDDPAEALKCAQNYCAHNVNAVTPLSTITPDDFPADPDGPIRIAYISADFREHPITSLIPELFELHDKARFELHGISIGPDWDFPARARVKAAFDHWHDIHELSDADAALLIRKLGIDIAVDLMGHTTDSRPAIFAHRPAPVQISYLGYPGTIGADFIDYILVDTHIVPPDQNAFYTEKLVYLPNSYMVNDRKRLIAEETPKRADCGLPETGFVYCAFNNAYKLTPEIFDIWMRLLVETPDGVLWLSAGNEGSRENLRREAKQRGVNPDRLVFAPRAEMPDHLARHRLADLFLDTAPFNAHTTASDALWSGLPVLTYSGASFASRVAGSLLHAVGLPELVVGSLADYEAMAFKLTRDTELLTGLRARLAENIPTAPLFDSRRFTRNLETAYVKMRQHWADGNAPEAFSVNEDETSPRPVL